MSVQLNQLADSINSALTEYSDTLADKIDNIVDEISGELRDELKQTSPKHTGKYKKGWKITVITKAKGNKKVIVHNKQFRLTHLLEYGHAKRNGGRTRAFPHISTSEEKYVDKFVKKVEEAINETT